MTERESPEPSNLWTLLGAGLTLILINSAFSKETAKKIGKRAGWKSEKSGKSFWDGWVLHMAHLDHTKDETYDEPERGVCVAVSEHLEMHEEAVGNAESIGLNECQNNYAIRMLKKTPIFNKHKK